jgi:hypothetical protein
MAAQSIIDSLAGRGLVLSTHGARVVAWPASLLTDEDRELIRRSRDDLFALLSSGQAKVDPERQDARPIVPGPSPAVEAVESVEATGSDDWAASLGHRRPASLARWPIPDCQRWGELANRFEAEGVNWREAERRAYEIVRTERAAAGRSRDHLPIEEDPDPYPFPAWDDLIDPREPISGEAPSTRPPGRLTWGITKQLRVRELATWTPSRQAKEPVIKVTAEGWGDWYPVEPGDLPSSEEAGVADERQGFFDW